MRHFYITIMIITSVCLYAAGAFYAIDILWFLSSPLFWAGNMAFVLIIVEHFNKTKALFAFITIATFSTFGLIGHITNSILASFISTLTSMGKVMKSRKDILRETADSIILQHQKDLGIHLRQMTHIDGYGNINREKWHKKGIPEFVNSVLSRKMPELNVLLEDHNYKCILINAIHSTALNGLRDIEKDEIATNYKKEMKGLEYEHYCRDIFEKNGWNAKVTKASGDQGIDLICHNNGLTVGVQCKHYRKPVTNKAVQEVVSGLKFHNLAIGVVVTNNTFTESAKKLAYANNVMLISHSDISGFYDRIKGTHLINDMTPAR